MDCSYKYLDYIKPRKDSRQLYFLLLHVEVKIKDGLAKIKWRTTADRQPVSNRVVGIVVARW